MLRLDLNRLAREGTLPIEAHVAPDDPLWEGTDLAFDGPVEFDLTASQAGTGEVVVRGRVEGRLLQECRRCLESVPNSLSEDLVMVFAAGEDDEENGDGDVRRFPDKDAELDLKEALREEVVLAVDPYVVCDPECAGLCPQCGTNRNSESCDCVAEEADPRWDTLRSLQEE